MQLHKLTLTNYRNHKDFETTFDPNISVITGPNGIGKTNILEAIHLLSITKPYRAHYDKDAIMHDKKFTRVEGSTYNETEKDRLELLIVRSDIYENASSKKVKINGTPKTLFNFSTNLNTVLFSPEDIETLNNSPGRRRKFINAILVQIQPDYKKTLSNYVKAVRQRNKILELIKETHKGFNQIEYWDDKILEQGMYIQKKRKELFNFLNHRISDHNAHLNHGTAIKIKYKINEINQKRLDLYKDKEIQAKTTLLGPHRDDFEISINGFNIAHFGSRGQQRSSLFALKLAEIDFFLEKKGKRPILLLDDIFSELDYNHRNTVFDLIKKQQTIITSVEDVSTLADYKEINLNES